MRITPTPSSLSCFSSTRACQIVQSIPRGCDSLTRCALHVYPTLPPNPEFPFPFISPFSRHPRLAFNCFPNDTLHNLSLSFPSLSRPVCASALGCSSLISNQAQPVP
ncbi:hypothetical protein CKAH01_08249 [Colletotrichum kahawae]|uniref:Uncharacterized protein n=1 Tax=Colletotrichum kahawae TaxID=34407 RepID=A0AAD9Y350_COLKA|nr:hypothetical protein CKAH01_08249 [Colletotrichum kahawae]